MGRVVPDNSGQKLKTSISIANEDRTIPVTNRQPRPNEDQGAGQSRTEIGVHLAIGRTIPDNPRQKFKTLINMANEDREILDKN